MVYVLMTLDSQFIGVWRSEGTLQLWLSEEGFEWSGDSRRVYKRQHCGQTIYYYYDRVKVK